MTSEFNSRQCPVVPDDLAAPLARWLGHRLRNAATPLTISMDVARDRATAALPTSLEEILRLAEEVARLNEIIEDVVREIRYGSH